MRIQRVIERFVSWKRVRHLKRGPLCFIGDSHVQYFVEAAKLKYFGDRPFSVCAVGGATAVGLRNPNSLSNAIETYKHHLANLSRDTIIIIHLGEVHCGFVFWYRAAKHKKSLIEQIAQSITAYGEFVRYIFSQGFRSVVLTSATLPTIKDGQDWGEIANLRREVQVTQAARTELTLSYNAAVKLLANRHKAFYFDVSLEMLDPDSGVVAERFINRDPCDHHLDLCAAAKAWGALLTPLLNRHACAKSDSK